MKFDTPISAGELVDKITILKIKSEMIKDESKLKEVKKEKKELGEKLLQMTSSEEFEKKYYYLYSLQNDLYKTNLKLWKIEDDIRECERKKDFGEKFIQLARDVYYTNDNRFNIKNKINQLTNSEIKEVKSYESYS